MPKAAPRPCTYPSCKEYAVKDGRCETHKVAHRWQSRKRTTERGYGWAWVKLRRKVIARDKHLCQECLRQGIYTQGNEVDHIRPKSQGGTDDLNNLEILCSRHHREKSLVEAREGRA